MELLVKTTEELETAARSCVDTLPHSPERATVVTLSGELGAGKTAFVQAAARYCGVGESVTSPTFVIERIYDVHHGPFRKLIHIDAYRLHDARELLTLGWEELVKDPTHLIFLEWPERVPEIIPMHARRISIVCEHDAQGDTRRISYDH